MEKQLANEEFDAMFEELVESNLEETDAECGRIGCGMISARVITYIY